MRALSAQQRRKLNRRLYRHRHVCPSCQTAGFLTWWSRSQIVGCGYCGATTTTDRLGLGWVAYYGHFDWRPTS